MKNNERRSYFKLTFKEKQMVNNIMLKQDGYFSIFNISIMIISALCMFISLSQNNLILSLIIILIMSLVIRFKMFYYYLKHTEINFDNDSKENNEMSKYTDNQTKLIVGLFVGIILFAIIGMFVGDFIDGNRNGNGSESCYTRSDGKKCCTACRKNEYGIPKCSTVCN